MYRDDPFQLEAPLRPAMQAVDPELVKRQPTFTKALALCQTLSGLDDAQFYGPGRIVKQQAQWSRIFSPASEHNFPQEKLNAFMDTAGNEAPMLWLLHSRGYDLHSLRPLETKTERENRQLREENAALRRVLQGAV